MKASKLNLLYTFAVLNFHQDHKIRASNLAWFINHYPQLKFPIFRETAFPQRCTTGK